MKIDIEKQISFLKKLIDDTKTQTISWEQPNSDSGFVYHALSDFTFEPECVFDCVFPKELNGHFMVGQCDDGTVIGAVGVRYEQLTILNQNNDDISVLLTRLLYLISENRFNTNKFIDSYLSYSIAG